MATQFTYSVANDTANGLVALKKLTNEIRAAAISIALDGVSKSGDNLIVDFKADLAALEVSVLNGLISAHDGKPSIDDPTEFQLVDDDGNAIGSVDDNGLKRIAFDFGSGVVTGPQGEKGEDGEAGPAGFGVYAFANVSSAGAISKGRGLSISKTSTGTYEYSFTTPTPDANYIVSAGFENLGTNTDTNWFVNSKTINGFILTTGIGDNGTGPDTLADTNHNVTILGDAGPQGITSAYEAWLNVGNSGTEADFIATLVGPPGTQGPTGATGAQGPQGQTGTQGPQGQTGQQGIQGEVGPQGQQGPQGATGAQGPQGPTGPAGIYGTEYTYINSEVESTTTSSSYIAKTTLNTTTLPPGTYEVKWYCEIKSNDNRADYRVVVDGVVVAEFQQTRGASRTEFWSSCSGFYQYINSFPSTLTATIEYNDGGGNTAFIRRARLNVIKVTDVAPVP